jgi:phosphonate degradation associated HDIG domain protein
MTQVISQKIISLFENKGGSMYGGEEVTQLEHALQCAHLAAENNASDELITAALLHDVGHLLHDLPDDASDKGIDDVHEELGATFLENYFKPAVVEPVKLHVAAKRYLCSMVDGYWESLSRPSQISLEFQGGKMNETEMKKFEETPFYKDAIELRKWDDLAKDPELKTAPVEHFVKNIENSIK